jgi:hypothetical protein
MITNLQQTQVTIGSSTLQLWGVCNSVKYFPAGLKNNSAIHPIKNKKQLFIPWHNNKADINVVLILLLCLVFYFGPSIFKFTILVFQFWKCWILTPLMYLGFFFNVTSGALMWQLNWWHENYLDSIMSSTKLSHKYLIGHIIKIVLQNT